jgi:hypothetical protein
MKKHRKAFVSTSITGKINLRKRFHGRRVKKEIEYPLGARL